MVYIEGEDPWIYAIQVSRATVSIEIPSTSNYFVTQP